jgi:tRNA 5-methylaminomethyl-2-thiouridine biosynthesis bifunctional protein
MSVPTTTPALAAVAAAPTPDLPIDGSLLSLRWTGRDRFVVLVTRFGAGHRFLATWRAWRADPQRCSKLVYIAIDPQPPSRVDLAAAHRATPCDDLAAALLAAWPPLTANLHRLVLDGGHVELLLLFTEVQSALPELVASVDAFLLDARSCDPTEPPGASQSQGQRIGKALGRLAARDATLVALAAPKALRGGLKTAGFVTRSAAGGGDGHDMTLATFAPEFAPRRARARTSALPVRERRALIIGAGLAGCATAWALAGQGWRAHVLERHSAIASEGSGNPAGLFHGIVNTQDGLHARFNRAAGIEAHRAVEVALSRHGVSGGTTGLLRLESVLDLSTMQATLSRLGLPPDYVVAIDAPTASTLAGIALSWPAWFYPGGGWVDPRGLARSFLERAGVDAALHTGVEVDALERTASGWRVLDRRGAVIDEAEVVVLANAGDASRLLGDAAVPMAPVRGQISVLPASGLALLPGRRLPDRPIAGAGYLLPEVNGQAIFGATAQPGDLDASIRLDDHAANLAQLERLTGARPNVRADQLEGRTAWRWVTADRLPIIGAVPDVAAPGGQPGMRSARRDQPRFVPRLPGLFAFTALGSRGITWSPLGAQVLVALINGAPVPIEASLLDAIDPARFIARRARRAARP